LPDYEKHLDVLRTLGKWQFDKQEFAATYKEQYAAAGLSSVDALEKLYEFSFIGFYRAGGRGFGGSNIASHAHDSIRRQRGIAFTRG
jgi:hypothetical protein